MRFEMSGNIEKDVMRLGKHIHQTPGLTALFFDGDIFWTVTNPEKIDDSIKESLVDSIGCYDYRVNLDHLKDDISRVYRTYKTPEALLSA